MEHNKSKLQSQTTKRKRNELIKLRILSIEKDTESENLSFLAIDKEKSFVHGS